MESKDALRLIRRVGFGLGPNETLPDDPIGWAQAQLDRGPPMQFLLQLDEASKAKIPGGEIKLLNTQAEAVKARFEHEAVEKRSNALSKTLSKEEWIKHNYETFKFPILDFEQWKEVAARGGMAVQGSAPVFERFWHFWTNHFTVSISSNNDLAIGPYGRMLRQRMSGSFRDMLFEAVTHPAMVLFLDNYISTGPNSVARKRRWTEHSINENLGREMLELFSVTPAAGYSQADVLGATNILTGWGIDWDNEIAEGKRVRGSVFRYENHEPGSQTVLGKQYSAFVRNDGKLNDLIDDLAVHPATARHIAHKLATVFIDDEPPVESVQRLEAVFVRTKGNLPALHKAVVEEVARASSSTRKFHNPETWLWSLHRMTGMQLPSRVPHNDLNGTKLTYLLEELGHRIHRCPQPNGWPLKAREWFSREMLDRRIRYGYEFAKNNRLGLDEWQAVVARQQWGGTEATQRLRAAQKKGEIYDPRELWSAFLASPDMLWS
jgi:uncharacterized protein (DUF1800 family)